MDEIRILTDACLCLGLAMFMLSASIDNRPSALERWLRR